MSQGTMSVSSLNTKIKSLLETTFMHVLVEGEVSSVTYHNSGHVYFSIKDKDSSIKCVMFRSNANKMKFRLERGQHVLVNGSISVYTPRGEYQLMTVSIEPFGQGALALAYEQLKEKLAKKGYFEQHRKKPQPKYIKKVALVTASKSAALQDMLKIIENRWRLLEVMVIDTLVQGESAGVQIAAALAYADTLNCDVIVVGRGGGSKEDLWAFNEEVVADAIYALNTFVVSAVGHEIDVQISDFVADLRASTPSSAMEMILPDQNEILYTLSEMQERYARVMQQILGNKAQKLNAFSQEFQRHSVSRKITMMEKEFENLEDEFKRVMQYQMTQYENRVMPLDGELKEKLDYALKLKSTELKTLEEKLRLYNPKKKQKEGWAEVVMAGKRVDLASVQKDDKFMITDTQTKLEVLCLNKKEI
ncbi:MAG: Exodeoxyribonuclease VII large subunit (EC [uncultured Sulfurovum sp.]|uniref:Exodeoxyribonuclease 7 large subunit n=1 Tax=uncultured Sulfurovum sp. TaxID=269237 RepID=A0A6S6SY00_9BACT|nr:MAG: Exodeoxyribonuclease VII large subunit (EC [uncultured Sulfurovum sp.]